MCTHPDFIAHVVVSRLESEARQLDFAADVTITCAECKQPFIFLGLPAGLDLHGATTSIDQTEARLAIAPQFSHYQRLALKNNLCYDVDITN